MGTVATKQAPAYIARMLYNKSSTMYIGLGKSTPWNDDNNVPDNSDDAVSLDEPIAYTKAQKVYLCKLATTSGEGTIAFGGNYYSIVTDTTRLDSNAKYVYASAEFSFESMKKDTQFRQVGLFIDFVPNDGVESKIVLPSQVAKLGTMLSISNNKLVNITKTSAVTVGAMYSILPVLN